MARSFSGTNTARLASPVAPTPTTGSMSFWLNTTDISGVQMYMMFWNTDSSAWMGVYNGGDTKIYYGWMDVLHTKSVPATDLAANLWHHLCLRWNSSATNKQVLWKDGVLWGALTDSMIANTITKMAIGSHYDSTSYPIKGKIAQCCYWNVFLTDNEVYALASGVRPNRIRPASIQGNFPFDGIESPEPDLSGNGKVVTLAGPPPYANGPPINLFTPKWPNNDFTTSTPSFIPAWAAQSNLPVIGAGTY